MNAKELIEILEACSHNLDIPLDELPIYSEWTRS